MTYEQMKVLEFNQKYGCAINDKPTMPDAQARLLRARLIVEEAAEFLAAAERADMVEMCDALADVLYVVYQAGVVMGVDLSYIFDVVHASNMTKDGGRDSGGKVLKGTNFRPPDIASELREQGWNPRGE